jgi:hypothetical protein
VNTVVENTDSKAEETPVADSATRDYERTVATF